MGLFNKLFRNTSNIEEEIKKFFENYFEEYFYKYFELYFKKYSEELRKYISKNAIKINELEKAQKDMLKELEKLRQFHAETPPPSLIYPPDEPTNDLFTWEIYVPPVTINPIYLVPFTNDVGLKTTRVTDYTVQGTGKALRHHYSKDQPWNSDGTLIKMAISGTTGILDGNNYSVVGTEALPSDATWSYTDPKLLYGLSGNSFVSYNVDTDTQTIIKTFTGFTNMTYGDNEGNMSIDDRYIGLQAEQGGDNYLIVYDRVNDITYTENLGAIRPNWFSVCQSGLYAVALYATDGSAANQGIKVYDIDLTNYRHLSDDRGHSDLGIDVDGNDVLVMFAKNTPEDYWIRMIRLSDGLVTPLAYFSVGNHILYGGHISCRNYKRPGWAYITETNGSQYSTNEVVAVKLDGNNNIVERFGRHHASDQVYARQPMACPNPEGYKVFFTSDWNNYYNTGTGYTEEYRPSFVIEVEQSN